ncbi:metallophosphoesterase [Magnetococcus sp. PR-3]|uniref:metallophosphoesterase n=1 Tax=Magnetococcus sp. PR-3 TaxID=3120355 RepID=UPI002FCE0D37
MNKTTLKQQDDPKKIRSSSVWLTDIHLDFLDESDKETLYSDIRNQKPERIFISGDIATGTTITDEMEHMANALGLPIYFVLGNHDYYKSDFAQVNASIFLLCKNNCNLIWMREAGIIPLSTSTALIGHEGWADGGYGDFIGSTVQLTDYILIESLKACPTRELLHQKLRELGQQSAKFTEKMLCRAFTEFDSAILLTHVPPFREDCLYQNRPSNDEWAPHFSNRSMGEMLTRIMLDHKDKNLTVLCGHTHHLSKNKILPNLEVLVGTATYGAPEIQPW